MMCWQGLSHFTLGYRTSSLGHPDPHSCTEVLHLRSLRTNSLEIPEIPFRRSASCSLDGRRCRSVRLGRVGAISRKSERDPT